MSKYRSHHSVNCDFAYFHGYLDAPLIYANYSVV